MTSDRAIDAEFFAYSHHTVTPNRRSGERYIEHVRRVVELLEEQGYDEITQAIGWLHDVTEKTHATFEELREEFDERIVNGVYILDRQTLGDERLSFSAARFNAKNRQAYRQRLAEADAGIQRVKLADIIDNTRDLENLGRGRRLKVESAPFYIHLAKKVAPEFAGMIEANIQGFLLEHPQYHKYLKAESSR